MARPDSKQDFGPLESQVMDAVWQAAGPVSVREVVDRLNTRRKRPLAYTTVMTVMGRLAEKQALLRHREGRSYLYEAGAQDAAGLAVKDLLRDHGHAALAHLLDEARADPEVLERLRGLLAEADG